MNDSRKTDPDAKWARSVLKSRWYDDQEGSLHLPTDALENELRASAERFIPRDETRDSSAEVELFFDVLGTHSEH